MKNIARFVTILWLFGMFTPVVYAQEVGQMYHVDRFCIGDDEFIKQFTNRLVREGMKAYNAVMNDPQVPCFDGRLYSVSPVAVQLVEKLWDFDLPEGEKLAMWKVRSANDIIGYIWFKREENPSSPNYKKETAV